MLTFGSLFAGIGGFDLGLERAGLACRWHVEIEPYFQQVLAQHWPHTGQWDDVRTFPPAPSEDWAVDVVCGGFPCQDISNAGKRAGIDGSRSGLWAEFVRIVRVLRPQFVVVENVAALRKYLDRILGDFAALGYDAEWSTLSACALGAPHTRDRMFIVAYPPGCEVQQQCGREQFAEVLAQEWYVHHWPSEPAVERVAHGLPHRLDRIAGCGNAVVPHIAELLGKCLLKCQK